MTSAWEGELQVASFKLESPLARSLQLAAAPVYVGPNALSLIDMMTIYTTTFLKPRTQAIRRRDSELVLRFFSCRSGSEYPGLNPHRKGIFLRLF